MAAALPESCTGADLLQVVSTARSAAVRAVVAKLHAGKLILFLIWQYYEKLLRIIEF